jgi:zinc protease
VVIVDKPEQTQTEIRIGSLGVPRNTPDFFPIAAFNTALGGAFTSRLMREIRVKRGLVYSCGSSFNALRAGGVFEFAAATRNESTGKAIEVALGQIAAVKKKGVTAKELKTAQSYVAALYPSRVETNMSLAGALGDIEVFGLPDDWIERFRERLTSVTLKEANQAAAARLLATRPAIVLCGNAQEIGPQVSKWGPVAVKKLDELR